MERPIELVPAKHRALLAARREVLHLPMVPQPVVTEAVRGALAGALLEIGCSTQGWPDAELLDMAFREGFLPDLRCPWGRGGDLLWAREPWTTVGIHYRYCNRDAQKGDEMVWYPAARMPKEAARLWMKIDDVGIGCVQGSGFVWELTVEVRR